MVITELKPTRREGRVNVYIDGEYAFTVYADTVSEYDLFPENVFDESKKDEILEKDSERYAKAKAFDYLSRGASTVLGMKRRLLEKKIPVSTVNKTLDYLVENGFLNDAEYAENAVSFLHEIKRYGKSRIEQVLFEKGVPKDIAEEAVERYFADCERPDVLSELVGDIAAKYDLSDRATKDKLIKKLLRQGFSYEEIKTALSEYISNEENDG